MSARLFDNLNMDNNFYNYDAYGQYKIYIITRAIY